MFESEEIAAPPTNDLIPCEPFPDIVVEKEFRHGVAVPKQNKGKLTALRVLFRCGCYEPGYVVYVRADAATTMTWAKEVLEKDGVKFILVPIAAVVLVELKP